MNDPKQKHLGNLIVTTLKLPLKGTSDAETFVTPSAKTALVLADGRLLSYGPSSA